MTDFPGLVHALVGGGVEFLIVGGFAGTVHGSAIPTRDLDVVYRRTPENIERRGLAKTESRRPRFPRPGTRGRTIASQRHGGRS